VLCDLLRYNDSDYPFGICCLTFFDLRILITSLVFSNSSCIYHVLQKLNIADDYDEKRALHFNPSEKQYPSPLDDIFMYIFLLFF
jgi:hypothetical protein